LKIGPIIANNTTIKGQKMLNANKNITIPKTNPNNLSEAISSKTATIISNMTIPPL